MEISKREYPVAFEDNGQLTMVTHYEVERSGESRDVEVTFTGTGS